MKPDVNRPLWVIAVLLMTGLTGCAPHGAMLDTSADPVAAVITPDAESDRAPEYSNNTDWAANAEHPGASAAMPAGASTGPDEKPVDVFYIHPTTFRSDTAWNQSLDDAKVNQWTDESVIARQAGVFNACCRVFAPRFRAASFLATTDRLLEGRGGQAYDLAYRDVTAAFDYFLEHYNNGRPFVLAGHSQGGLLVSRLLADRIDGKPLGGRMVAAYSIGFNLPVGLFGIELTDLQPCEHPTQTGCVLSWNALTPEADREFYRRVASEKFVRDHGATEGRDLLCINPLTFDRSRPAAGADQSLGAVPGKPGYGPLRDLVAGAVAAECIDGWLVVDAAPILELEPLPGGSMHYHEFGLFYQDIRANIAARAAAFISAEPALPESSR